MDLLAFSTDVVPKVGSSFTPGWMLDVCRTSDVERDGDADRPTLEGIFALEVAGSLVLPGRIFQGSSKGVGFQDPFLKFLTRPSLRFSCILNIITFNIIVL